MVQQAAAPKNCSASARLFASDTAIMHTPVTMYARRSSSWMQKNKQTNEETNKQAAVIIVTYRSLSIACPTHLPVTGTVDASIVE